MKKGDRVMLNPEVGEYDFHYGLGGAVYNEVGVVTNVTGEVAVTVEWPTYGRGWNGLENELIYAEMENE